MKLIIVVPCYNEEAVLAETTHRLSEILDGLRAARKVDEAEILYIDDGSHDRTWEMIEGFSVRYPYVHIFGISSTFSLRSPAIRISSSPPLSPASMSFPSLSIITVNGMDCTPNIFAAVLSQPCRSET